MFDYLISSNVSKDRVTDITRRYTRKVMFRVWIMNCFEKSDSAGRK